MLSALSNLLILLPADHLNLFRAGGFTIAAWVVGTTIFTPIALPAVAALFATKSERDAKIAAIITGIFIALFAMLSTLIGLSCYLLMPDIPSRLSLWKMGEHLGTVMSTMLVISVIAAIIISTAPTFFWLWEEWLPAIFFY